LARSVLLGLTGVFAFLTLGFGVEGFLCVEDWLPDSRVHRVFPRLHATHVALPSEYSQVRLRRAHRSHEPAGGSEEEVGMGLEGDDAGGGVDFKGAIRIFRADRRGVVLPDRV
jgi:hypothetical protein